MKNRHSKELYRGKTMNKKYVGVSLEEAIKVWEKKDPGLRAKIDEYKEKAELAMLLKKTRTKEAMSQTELAKKANVPQSVIARIESLESKSLPRLDLYSRIMSSIGYPLRIFCRLSIGSNCHRR
jgi:ribosome-binding protein aMBF1 (putative translation factor)